MTNLDYTNPTPGSALANMDPMVERIAALMVEFADWDADMLDEICRVLTDGGILNGCLCGRVKMVGAGSCGDELMHEPTWVLQKHDNLAWGPFCSEMDALMWADARNINATIVGYDPSDIVPPELRSPQLWAEA